MLERLLRNLAILLSVIVASGFVLFALEDIDRGSSSTVQRIAGYTATSPSSAGERERERRHGQPREAIDDVNDVLLKPFAGLSENAGSRWVQRGVPTALGLLIYGVLLGFIARYMKGIKRVPRRTVSRPA